MKSEKGITLVGLIITIIILVLLGFVAIISVSDINLFSKADDAAKMYEESRKNEIGYFKNSVEKMNTYIPSNETNKVPSIGAKIIAFKIDDKTFYAKEGMSWYEWCKSEYNTAKWVCNDLNSQVTNGGTISTGYIAIIYIERGYQGNEKRINVCGKDKIVVSKEYGYQIILPAHEF